MLDSTKKIRPRNCMSCLNQADMPTTIGQMSLRLRSRDGVLLDWLRLNSPGNRIGVKVRIMREMGRNKKCKEE